MLLDAMWTFEEDLAARNSLIKSIVALLASGKYSELQQITGGNRLSETELKDAILEYGRTLCPLPDEATDKIDYVVVLGSKPMRWSVVVPLFTVEEGQSDLSLELTLVESGQYKYDFEIGDLHVL